ncbi:MAG: hypothetical protein JHD16_06265, partial [Solirubrobacteraceae bacterium]|nr:hypothetical protein [Solirubrobacteraceae bacterium]
RRAMADDRLDDAIAAVVHAVDRIEQATRGVLDESLPELPPRPAPPEPRTPPPPAFSSQSAGFAARPTTALGGLGAVPAPQPSPELPEAATEQQPPLEYRPPSEQQPPFEPQPPFDQQPPFAQQPQFEQQPYDAPLPMQEPSVEAPAEQAPGLAPSPDPTWSDYEPFFPDDPGPLPLAADQAHDEHPIAQDAGDPSASVHELVGRIVARTQALEDHLDAARQLRAEITELVSRLAAAAERDH